MIRYQYLPIVITCAENDTVLLVGLRYGTAPASLGVDNDLRYLAGRIRAIWPDVHIHVRGDSGLGVPLMYDVCRELRLSYTFGIGMNSRLQDLSDDLLKRAVEDYEKTGQPQRLFLAERYQAGSWPAPQPIVIKVEAHAQGTNRRAVVTNRPDWEVLPSAVYDEYAERGESENRNKELKCELQADRLSDHRFLANYLQVISSCICIKSAGAAPAGDRPTTTDNRGTGLAGRVADSRDRRAGPQAVLQPATETRSAWGRISPAPGGLG